MTDQLKHSIEQDATRAVLAAPEQLEPDWKKPPEYVPPLVKWAQEQTAPPLRELSDDQLWKIWDEFYIDTPSYDRPSFELTLYRAVLAAARSSK